MVPYFELGTGKSNFYVLSNCDLSCIYCAIPLLRNHCLGRLKPALYRSSVRVIAPSWQFTIIQVLGILMLSSGSPMPLTVCDTYTCMQEKKTHIHIIKIYIFFKLINKRHFKYHPFIKCHYKWMLILTLADYYSLSYLAFTKYQIRLLSLLYL